MRGFGRVCIEITSSNMSATLQTIISNGIILKRITYVDDLRVRAVVMAYETLEILRLVENSGDRIQVLYKTGIWWDIVGILRRPVLIIGMLVILVLTTLLPTRILFVSVSGNSNLPDNLILEKAALSGIHFGASRKSVRSEKVKNALLSQIPELQWVGVNTLGCVANIAVSERPSQKGISTAEFLTNSVASMDGIVCKVETQKGTPLVKPGQAVKKGQILISGYIDCGRYIRVTGAEGEVYARTNRELETILPLATKNRGDFRTVITIDKLKIGKNIINLSKDSGIYNDMCVKMYEEQYLTLPGGMCLPIAWIREKYFLYDPGDIIKSSEDVQGNVQYAAECYLQSQMIAGNVEKKQASFERLENCFYLYTRYFCTEMIGMPVSEEFG